MKNAKMTWKYSRQAGVPHPDYWSSREQRRYAEREERRRLRKEAEQEAQMEYNYTVLRMLGAAVILVFLMIKGLQGDKWATLAVAAYAVWRSYHKTDSDESSD